MTDQVETQVLIVGGAPVGLTLAMDLARRGVRTVVAELRHKGEPPSVKCNPNYTLIRFDPNVGVSALLFEADGLGMPLDLLDVSPDEQPAVYDRALILARPD